MRNVEPAKAKELGDIMFAWGLENVINNDPM